MPRRADQIHSSIPFAIEVESDLETSISPRSVLFPHSWRFSLPATAPVSSICNHPHPRAYGELRSDGAVCPVVQAIHGTVETGRDAVYVGNPIPTSPPRQPLYNASPSPRAPPKRPRPLCEVTAASENIEATGCMTPRSKSAFSNPIPNPSRLSTSPARSPAPRVSLLGLFSALSDAFTTSSPPATLADRWRDPQFRIWTREYPTDLGVSSSSSPRSLGSPAHSYLSSSSAEL